MLETIYQKNVVKRTLFIWLGFSAALWLIFDLAYFTHPQAWGSVVEIQRQTGWGVFGTIIASNSLLLLLIITGNLFVRFGAITPGLIILAIQAVMIGWTAGTNGFSEPFASVAQAPIRPSCVSDYGRPVRMPCFAPSRYPSRCW